MADDAIKIVDQKEGTSFLPSGKQSRVITTTFYVGKDGPFAVSQDEESFDPTTQHQLILEKARKVMAARNHPSFNG